MGSPSFGVMMETPRPGRDESGPYAPPKSPQRMDNHAMVPLAGNWMEEYTPYERNDKFRYINAISILLSTVSVIRTRLIKVKRHE
jgi:hypothetical protein